MFRQSGSGEQGFERSNHGIGMANVERRLDLCFGAGKLDVTSIDNVTTVGFRVPATRQQKHTMTSSTVA
jgi:LytS/YehU family sensor histidine kinase